MPTTEGLVEAIFADAVYALTHAPFDAKVHVTIDYPSGEHRGFRWQSEGDASEHFADDEWYALLNGE